jgi:sulfofructosephosphate aldolase
MADLSSLALNSGGFAMVAVDQREALRGMYQAKRQGVIADSVLTDFKVAVADELSPLASGLLVDLDFGLRQIVDSDVLAPSCGLIAAQDLLIGPAGGAATDTAIDVRVNPAEMKALGAVALKLLILYRSDDDPSIREEMASTFVAGARANGLISLVEIIVKAPRNGGAFDREVEIVKAAKEASSWGMDLYKAEVPFGAKADDDSLRKTYRQMDEAIGMPWVVLSNGVAKEDFERAVTIACQSGASGFLAGRAVWADVVGDEDERRSLREISRPRLERFISAVDRNIATMRS